MAAMRSLITRAPRSVRPSVFGCVSLDQRRIHHKFDVPKPSIQTAKDMPREYSEMSINILIPLAVRGNYEARRERLIREIMAVDDVDHDTATSKQQSISSANRSGNSLYKLPYTVGITLAMVGGIASFPMVFDVNTALWFDENYVTTDVPPPEDLETMLEVGSWTWGWMEPPMGQLSFFFLCMAWARNQMLNIQVKPYTNWMMSRRAESLAAKYPEYDDDIVKDFSESDMFRE
mmetsp:Transcript_10370/g.12583  ORF Transcript_10370/g.12583 Transcript_10370/m.12583 type:complete len:233 (+) Transcript_10370:29-727(+)